MRAGVRELILSVFFLVVAVGRGAPSSADTVDICGIQLSSAFLQEPVATTWKFSVRTGNRLRSYITTVGHLLILTAEELQEQPYALTPIMVEEVQALLKATAHHLPSSPLTTEQMRLSPRTRNWLAEKLEVTTASQLIQLQRGDISSDLVHQEITQRLPAYGLTFLVP